MELALNGRMPKYNVIEFINRKIPMVEPELIKFYNNPSMFQNWMLVSCLNQQNYDYSSPVEN